MDNNRIELDPAVFLLNLMNNATIDVKLRVDAAKALMPFKHARAGEVGKKVQQQADAKKAATGRYAPSPPPLRAVK
jgi:phage terminase small subunit